MALFGAVAARKATKATGMSAAEAKTRLRGVKVSKLPARASGHGQHKKKR